MKKKGSSIRVIKEILSPRIRRKKEFMWPEINSAMETLTRKHTKEAEDLLVGLLEYEGPLRLAPQSDTPNLMSPEDMLKFLALQALSNWTGRKHLRIFKKVHDTTRSSTLLGMSQVIIERLKEGGFKTPIPGGD